MGKFFFNQSRWCPKTLAIFDTIFRGFFLRLTSATVTKIFYALFTYVDNFFQNLWVFSAWEQNVKNHFYVCFTFSFSQTAKMINSQFLEANSMKSKGPFFRFKISARFPGFSTHVFWGFSEAEFRQAYTLKHTSNKNVMYVSRYLKHIGSLVQQFILMYVCLFLFFCDVIEKNFWLMYL